MSFIFQELANIFLDVLLGVFRFILSAQFIMVGNENVSLFFFSFFAMFSMTIFVFSLIFLVMQYNVNKFTGNGASVSQVMVNILFGILHMAFASSLVPFLYYLLTKITASFLEMYLAYNKLQLNADKMKIFSERSITTVLQDFANVPGQALIFLIFYVLLLYIIFKILFMFFENVGVIMLQSAVFNLLIFDTILNDGAGTMRFLKIILGTILGQCMMMIFFLLGLILLFGDGSFFIGLCLVLVAKKIPTLVPGYLGSTGKLSRGNVAQALQTNLSILNSTSRLVGTMS